MTLELALDLLRQLITVSLMLIAPLLGTAIAIGLSVSLIQTVTSIQEQTLTFVPKLIGVGIVMIIASHWMVKSIMEFSITMLQRMVEMAP